LIEYGIQVGLLTNIYPGVFDLAIAQEKIPTVSYATVIQSCKCGYVKPQLEIYQGAERMSGVDGNEILFIDDKEEFLEPVGRLGWQTVLFDEKHPEKSIKTIESFFQ